MSCRLRALAFICGLPILLAIAPHEATAGGPLPFNRTVGGANAANASSWLAGAHAGYNWQQGAAVFGFETDLQATHLNSSMNGGLQATPPPLAPTDFATTHAAIDWYGTFRGRVGASMGSFLVYVTGGVAYGNVDLSSTFSAFGLTTYVQTLQTKIGGVGGFGFEYIVAPNVMLTFGYQYVDLGRINVSSATAVAIGCCASTTLSQSATVRAQFQTAMIGISWRFAPGGSGSPWAGGYAGAHGGGAWGNSASAVYNGTATLIGN
jgi:opacity protein-like surface antigen